MQQTSPELRAAWEEYYRALDVARDQMEHTPRFADNPQDRAKAYHTLMEVQAMAYNFVIAPRRDYPRIFRNLSWQTDIYTLGQNSPDFDYGNLFVDGAGIYRLFGRLGSSSLTLIQTFNGVFGDPGFKTTGNYDLKDFSITPDGTFDIILGGPKSPGNWIPIDETVGYQYVFIRRAIMDWNSDIGDLRIERIDAVKAGQYDADEFSEAEMAVRIHRATAFVRYLVNDCNVKLYDTFLENAGGRKNVMSGTAAIEGGSPSSNYIIGVFNLNDDEALIVELPQKPNGVYWSFQLGDVWSRSLPFKDRQTSLNNVQVKVDSDGAVRIVISKHDPGIANWLDPAGRTEGILLFRNFLATSAPVPTTLKIKVTELSEILPRDTPRVSLSEREAATAQRRSGYAKVFS